MEIAEIVAGRVADTMTEVKTRIRDYCASEGILIPNEAELERIVEPLRYQIAAMHTDGVEKAHGGL